MSETTPAVPAIYAALGSALAELGPIAKDRRNKDQGFMFRGIEDVQNALHPLLAKHGLMVVPRTLERISESRTTAKGSTLNVVHLNVEFTVFAEDGSSIRGSAWGEAQDSGDKATGKAHSMALKTFLLEVFMVPTEDMGDADAHGEEAAPRPPDEAEWYSIRQGIDGLTEPEKEHLRRWWSASKFPQVISDLSADQAARVKGEIKRLVGLRGSPDGGHQEAVERVQDQLGGQVVADGATPPAEPQVGDATFS